VLLIYHLSLACQTVCVGAAKKQSGHCCTLSVNTRNVYISVPRMMNNHLCEQTEGKI